MLKHLGNTTRSKLLELFNLGWSEAKVPLIWKEVVMLHTLKKGKNKQKASSYGTISLTSYVYKTIERIISSSTLRTS